MMSSESSVSSGASAARSRKNFETWTWLFTRISGLVLLFLALIHFSITHILNDVTDTSSGFVNNRWKNPLWRAFDWCLLVLALLHGLNGLRVIMEDYIRSPAKLRAAKWLMYLTTAALMLWGTYSILTFTAS